MSYDPTIPSNHGYAPNATSTYADALSPVTVNLNLVDVVQQTGGGGSNPIYQKLDYISNLIGSRYGDTLIGDQFDNIIAGGGGADTLTGGGGADTFRYFAASDSTLSASDTITDFQPGVDKIDLRDVRTGANDTFAIIQNGGTTLLKVDLGGDGKIDMLIRLAHTTGFSTSDVLWNGAGIPAPAPAPALDTATGDPGSNLTASPSHLLTAGLLLGNHSVLA